MAIRSGNPLNLMGGNAKAWFTAKKTTDDLDADALIALNSVDNPAQVVFMDASIGTFFVKLLPADTASIDDDSLVYDVQVREQDGRITTVAKGELKLKPDVTKTIV